MNALGLYGPSGGERVKGLMIFILAVGIAYHLQTHGPKYKLRYFFAFKLSLVKGHYLLSLKPSIKYILSNWPDAFFA